jgi:hypothetical protein
MLTDRQGSPFSGKHSTVVRFIPTDLRPAVLPADIILLLLTALVATDSATPGADDR